MGERRVFAREYDRRRVRRQQAEVREDQLDPGLERALKRHPLGSRIDAHGERREQNRARTGASERCSCGRRAAAID